MALWNRASDDLFYWLLCAEVVGQVALDDGSLLAKLVVHGAPSLVRHLHAVVRGGRLPLR